MRRQQDTASAINRLSVSSSRRRYERWREYKRRRGSTCCTHRWLWRRRRRRSVRFGEPSATERDTLARSSDTGAFLSRSRGCSA
jgi:hypothetical protein